jgi:DNA-directed RNA polymerase specialized sigma24 family protein
LVDRSGAPLHDHISKALCDLVPRFRHDFPTFTDEAVICELLENVGRKVALQEARLGARIERLHAYVWVALRRTAISWLRRASMRMARATLAADQSDAMLATMPGSFGSVEQIEQEILLEQALQILSPRERTLVMLRMLGFSSGEIAARQVPPQTPAAVDQLFCRAIGKMRRIFGVQPRECLRQWRSQKSSRDT